MISPLIIAQKCMKLIADDMARSALASRRQAIMERRDIRQYLQAVF